MEHAVFRIIDANFNRSREAVRVIEEFCRFALNSGDLSARAKQLRHRICTVIGGLDMDMLIAGRDVQADVGRGMQVEHQLVRGNLGECFTAASKRLTEALRVLAETAQTLDRSIGQEFEKLRFDAYALEKDIFAEHNISEKLKPVRLYVLLNATEASVGSEITELARECVAGGADCIQLRAKGVSDNKLFKLAAELVKICRAGSALAIINDRVDIAAISGADGVHLGQDDLPPDQGRKIQLVPMIFGVSTHSIDQLNAAIREKVDYAALGPVFATSTKPDADVAGLEYIAKAVELLNDTPIKHVAIGGVSLENIDQVLRAGARTIAVCSAVMSSSDPKTACSKLKDKIISYC